jgi:hypothetical protein
MFRSAEEKAAELQQRQAQQARDLASQQQRRQDDEQQEQRRRFLASPVGQATTAKEHRARFLELQLQVGSTTGVAQLGSVTKQGSVTSSAAVLAEVEDVGWRLEHASYFFVVTAQSSTERMFLSGQNTAVDGVTMGAYLFRNPDAGSASPGQPG